jgi:26S proteasome regulatory subunit N10
MVCVDNSDYMRNGDFLPTRLHAQQDAVNLICHSKTRANPENNVGLLSIANTTEVLVTLTTDVGKLLAKLHQVQPKGTISFVSAIRIAHLVLKHRQGKNHRMRIIVFVGSPVAEDEKELVKLAKRLRKEKVNVDIVNFGEESVNTDKLTTFINTLNGTDGNSSHLVTVPSGPLLSDALISSPIVVGEDGTGAVPGGYEFGIDPNEDPELALALRVSMEEQRARQEDESRKATSTEQPGGKPAEETMEEQLLRQAMEMSMQPGGVDMDVSEAESGTSSALSSALNTQRDLSTLTEDEQMAYALQMSMQPESSGATPMEEDAGAKATAQGGEENLDDVMADPAFLQSVLEDLPGVNPQDEAVKEAVKQLTKPDDKKQPKKDDKK